MKIDNIIAGALHDFAKYIQLQSKGCCIANFAKARGLSIESPATEDWAYLTNKEHPSLVAFFRGEGYMHFGAHGDANDLTPEEVAIDAMRQLMLIHKGKSVRTEIRQFSLIMEEKLKKNDHKAGWKNTPIPMLLGRLRREIHELEYHLYSLGVKDKAAIARECADVANFAMMIADVAGGLSE